MDSNKLGKYFYNLELPSGYASVEKLKKSTGVPRSDITKWLESQDTYTLHKPVRKRFPRNPYTVNNIDDLWEMDLVDVSNLSKYNNGYKYLLNIIDVFSKYAWSFPLKDKKANSVAVSLENLLKTRTPRVIQSDKGKEFINRNVQSILKKYDVIYQSTKNPQIKAAIIERFNRTEKTRMYKYFTHKNTYRYIDVIDKLLKGYNDSVHSTIGMKPSQVTQHDIKRIWHKMNKKRITQGHVQFNVGDYVRISKQKATFEKGYEENFTKEIFKVVKVINRSPQPLYELIDLNNEPIDGKFYNFELVRVKPSEEFKIEKIIKSRKRGGQIEHYVKWQGYNNKFNSWVSKSDMRKI